MPPQGSEEGWPGAADGRTPGYTWPPQARAAPPALPTSPRDRTTGTTTYNSRRPESSPERTASSSAATLSGASLPTGEACIASLAATGTTFERVEETRGISAPVSVKGPVGGVEYWASDKRPLLLDCRLGLALHRVGPLLRSHGVTRARFSGAYVYRTTRTGKLSLHAHGLAIDLHDIVVGGTTLTVKEHFARGGGCGGDVPLLNRIACDLAETRLFRELLTPDSNRDHHDHFHLAVAPAAQAPQGPTAAQNVSPAAAP